ncbi:MAG: hypothetical protein R6U97_09745 [Desulfosalsimonas sp.]
MKKTKNKMFAVLRILKSPEKSYNANNLAKVLGITPMGTLKILKKLKKEEILISKKIGNSHIYSLNFKNDFATEYATFLLKQEAESSSPFVKRWIRELKKADEAEISVIFGSALKVEENAKDIDVLFVVNSSKFDSLRKKIKKLNSLNEKKIHPVYQTKADIEKNIQNQDKVILNAIKGVVVLGSKKFVYLIEKAKSTHLYI